MKGKFEKGVVSFFKKLDGKEFSDMFFIATPDGIRGTQMDSVEVRLFDFSLDKDADFMIEYNCEKKEDLPIVDISLWILYLLGFEGIINFEKIEDKVVLFSETEKIKRRHEYLLCDKNYISKIDKTKTLDIKKFKFDFEEIVNVKFLENVMRNALALGVPRVKLYFEDGFLNFEVGEKGSNRMKESLKFSSSLKDIKEIFLDTEYFKEVVSSFTEDKIKISLGTENNPVLFEEKGTGWVVRNYLAPLSSD